MWGDILTVKKSKTGTVGKRQCLSTYYLFQLTVLKKNQAPADKVCVNQHASFEWSYFN